MQKVLPLILMLTCSAFLFSFQVQAFAPGRNYQCDNDVGTPGIEFRAALAFASGSNNEIRLATGFYTITAAEDG